ncbi:hypothetical protein BJP62_01020 [Jeongeupia sp. USM3]|nr:hypothetical protein BJP62_01020 [Jeongeupia sp. USM3]
MSLSRVACVSCVAVALLSLPSFTVAATTAVTVPVQKSGGSDEAQILFWNSIKDSKDPAEFQAYLDQFPNGVFAKLAEVKLAKLQKPAIVSAVRPASVSVVSQSAQVPLAYRVSYGGRLQELTLRYDGKVWVVNDPIDRHACLLGAITDISLGAGVFDAKRLLDEAASGLNVTYKRKVFGGGGNEVPAWYKYTRMEEGGALVRLTIEGDQRGKGPTGGNDSVRLKFDVVIDRQRGVVTSAKSMLTSAAGGRSACDVVLAD